MKVEDVNRLLKQFGATQKLMRQMRGKRQTPSYDATGNGWHGRYGRILKSAL